MERDSVWGLRGGRTGELKADLGQPANKPRPGPWLIAGVVGALVLAVVVGLALPRLLSADQLHPQGPASAWLDERYANGVSSWTTESLPVGVSTDRNIVAVTETAERRLTREDLVGLDVFSGTERWRVEAADCSLDSVRDGIAWCTRSTETGDDVLRIDLNTGTEQAVYWAPFRVSSLRAVGTFDEQIILQTRYVDESGDWMWLVLALPGDGSIAWQTVVPEFQECELVDVQVVCEGLMGFTALDASTGEPTVSQIYPTEGVLRTVDLALDGFVVTEISVSEFERTTVAYDYDGNSLGDWDHEVTVLPSDVDGIYYPLDDQKRMGEILTVDAEGRPVAFVRPGGGVKLASGVEWDDKYVAGAAADGSVLFVTDEELGHPAIYLADGTLVAEIDSAARTLGPFRGLLIGFGGTYEPVMVVVPVEA